MFQEGPALDTVGKIVNMQHFVAFSRRASNTGRLPPPAGAAIRRANRLTTSTTGKISMAVQRTFSIIKPDATRRNITGKIIDRLESAGLRVVAQKRLQLTKEQAEGFYAVHKERPFFGELVSFMISGPVVVQVLE